MFTWFLGLFWIAGIVKTFILSWTSDLPDISWYFLLYYFFNGCHLFSVYFIHILLASWITSFFDSHIRCESVLIVWIVLNFFPSSYACVISSHLSYLLHWFSFFLFLKTQWFYLKEFMILLNTNWVCECSGCRVFDINEYSEILANL